MSSQADATVLPALGLATAADCYCSSPAGFEEQPALSSATVRGGIYLAGRYGLGVLVSVGNMLVMTWWIGPHAYGVFVTAIGLITFLATLARGGIDTFLVRSEVAPDGRTCDTASTIILGISLGLMLIAAALTPLLVRWYGSREFVWPYLILLLTVPVSGLTGIPMAKLERDLDFRRVAGIELGGQSLGLAVAVLSAWSRAGVWAPVAGLIAWQTFTLFAAGAAAALGLRPRFDHTQARRMLVFGLGMTASMRAWQLRTLVNPLLVGRFAGVEGVAFVALAIRIAEALGTFRLAAGRMAIAALARLQDSRERFRRALEQALYYQVISLGPLLCGFVLVGPFVVRHIIGVRWASSLTVYPFVAAGVLVNSVYNLQASALFVVERQWIVMRSYVAHVVLLGAGTRLFLPRAGISGYGWAELLACAAYLLIHRGVAETVALSYRKLVPWVAVFVPILFLSPIAHFFSHLLARFLF